MPQLPAPMRARGFVLAVSLLAKPALAQRAPHCSCPAPSELPMALQGALAERVPLRLNLLPEGPDQCRVTLRTADKAVEESRLLSGEGVPCSEVARTVSLLVQAWLDRTAAASPPAAAPDLLGGPAATAAGPPAKVVAPPTREPTPSAEPAPALEARPALKPVSAAEPAPALEARPALKPVSAAEPAPALEARPALKPVSAAEPAPALEARPALKPVSAADTTPALEPRPALDPAPAPNFSSAPGPQPAPSSESPSPAPWAFGKGPLDVRGSVLVPLGLAPFAANIGGELTVELGLGRHFGVALAGALLSDVTVRDAQSNAGQGTLTVHRQRFGGSVTFRLGTERRWFSLWLGAEDERFGSSVRGYPSAHGQALDDPALRVQALCSQALVGRVFAFGSAGVGVPFVRQAFVAADPASAAVVVLTLPTVSIDLSAGLGLRLF